MHNIHNAQLLVVHNFARDINISTAADMHRQVMPNRPALVLVPTPVLMGGQPPQLHCEALVHRHFRVIHKENFLNAMAANKRDERLGELARGSTTKISL
jgi:hypothetical protein